MITALMFVVLILSYALMVGLVKFTENIVAARDAVSTDGGAITGVADTDAPSTGR